MDRFISRTFALTAGLAACGLAAAVALSGCGAGQVSQMATQEPAVNGTSGTVGPISLRNIHLRAAQSTDYDSPPRRRVVVRRRTGRRMSTTSWSRSPPTSARSARRHLASRQRRSGGGRRTPRRFAGVVRLPMPPRQRLRCPRRSPTADVRVHLRLREGRRDHGARDFGR